MKIVKTDYLISECTFGLPIFKWDESNKIANDISKWITNSPEKTSLLFCYSLGKAQRLLNEISQTILKAIFIPMAVFTKWTIFIGNLELILKILLELKIKKDRWT